MCRGPAVALSNWLLFLWASYETEGKLVPEELSPGELALSWTTNGGVQWAVDQGPRAHSGGSLERRGQQLLPVAGGMAPAPPERAAGPVRLRASGLVWPPRGARGVPWPGTGARSARRPPSLILALGGSVGRNTALFTPCSVVSGRRDAAL